MNNIFKKMCINQGYVPPTCTMDGQLCWLLVNSQGDPCKGCNADRNECKGRLETVIINGGISINMG